MYLTLMNVMDADAVRFLKIFTFLSLDEIEDIRKQFEAAPHERLAQKSWLVKSLPLFTEKKLTKKLLTSLSNSLQETSKIFLLKSSNKGLRGVPNHQVQADENHNIVELLVSSGVVNSKRQAREDVQNGAYLRQRRPHPRP